MNDIHYFYYLLPSSNYPHIMLFYSPAILIFSITHGYVPWIHTEDLDHSTSCYYRRLLLPLFDRTLTPLENPSHASASPICSKGIWADQERDMIVFLGTFNREGYLDPGIEALSVCEIKIFLRSEDDFVCSASSKCGILLPLPF